MNHRFVVRVACSLVEAGQHNIAFTVKNMRQVVRVHACRDEAAANSAERLGSGVTCATVVKQIRAVVAGTDDFDPLRGRRMPRVWRKLAVSAEKRKARHARHRARMMIVGVGLAAVVFSAAAFGLGRPPATP